MKKSRLMELAGLTENLGPQAVIKSIQDKVLRDYGGKFDAEEQRADLYFDLGGVNDQPGFSDGEITINNVTKLAIYGEINGVAGFEGDQQIPLEKAPLDLLNYINDSI